MFNAQIVCILKLSNYEATPYLFTLSYESPNVQAVFWRDPACLHTYSMSPCQALDGFLCVLSPQKLYILKPKSPKNTRKHLAKNTKHKTKQKNGNGLAAFIEYVCQISGYISKNGVDIGCSRNLRRSLNQPTERK